MPLPPETRASLLLRIQDPADVEAWTEFQEIYQPLVYRLGRSRGLQDADARELAQEVMIAVSGAIERWQPDRQRGTFRTWLYRVARNTLLNQLARQSRREQASGGSDVQRSAVDGDGCATTAILSNCSVNCDARLLSGPPPRPVARANRRPGKRSG